MDKFGTKKSRLPVLTEDWHTWYLGSADFESGLRFWNSDPKIHFWANLGRKIQSCRFFLKTGTHDTLTMLILIPTLVFWISHPKSIFGQTLAKNVKVDCFAWKLVHMFSWGYWFLFQHWFSEFQNPNPFLGKFGPKNSKLSSLAENWRTECLDDVDLLPTLLFSVSNPKSFFEQIWAEKFKVVYFD